MPVDYAYKINSETMTSLAIAVRNLTGKSSAFTPAIFSCTVFLLN